MKIIGQKIIHYDSVTSTNDILKEEPFADEDEGIVVRAAEQTKGRGRHGNNWYSAKGLGLYFSVLLRPRIDPALLGLLSLFPAIAVARALIDLCRERAFVKWPNDVLMCGRKVAGILCEAKSQGGGIKSLIIGIGVNLYHTIEDFPPDLRNSAGSVLICTNRIVDDQALLRKILGQLNTLYQKNIKPGKLNAIVTDWNALCGHLNRDVRIASERKTISGRFLGIDHTGAAIIRTKEEKIVHLAYGEFTLRSENVIGN